MLLTIIAWIWIILGIVFVLKPAMLKNKINKMGVRRLRKYFIFLAFLIGTAFLSIGIKFSGAPAKIVFVIGIIAIIKGVLFLKGRIAEKMIELTEKLPVFYYRLGGIAYIVLGFVILALR